MYELNDTITAVSSPAGSHRVILRLTGRQTIQIAKDIFTGQVDFQNAGVYTGQFFIDQQLSIEGKLYLFLSPASYTGEDLVEIHIYSNPAVTETLLSNILNNEARLAGPGEFTARAYLNGKIDLAQAEAVNEIIFSSNQLQLDAAEKLLAGKLTQTTKEIKTEILDCLGNLEAGLDFSTEDIEFITTAQAVEILTSLKQKAEDILKGSISCQAVIDLPSVGAAGIVNAGKSSLTNILLGCERSIVSEKPKTTRDVLEGLLELDHSRCIFFDCAGLIEDPQTIIDQLTQQAAVEALRHAMIVLFCVDISKPNWNEDINLLKLVDSGDIIFVAAKADLLEDKKLSTKLNQLRQFFGHSFLPVSSKTKQGIKELLTTIDSHLISKTPDKYPAFSEPVTSSVALTARHKKSVAQAVENLTEAINQIKAGSNEIATIMLRSAYQNLSRIEQQDVDEKILSNIFSNFCIGK